MLNNVRYDKIKLLHKLSCLIWFIEKHGIEDAQAAGDEEALNAMQELKQDLQRHLDKLDAACCCKADKEQCSACRS